MCVNFIIKENSKETYKRRNKKDFFRSVY